MLFYAFWLLMFFSVFFFYLLGLILPTSAMNVSEPGGSSFTRLKGRMIRAR